MSGASEQTIALDTELASAPASPGLVSRPAPEPPRYGGSAATLADLMIVALLAPGGGHAALEPYGERACLALRRGNATVARLVVAADVAAAAIGRLAKAAGLDPLVERGTVTQPSTARLAVRAGDTLGEILITVGTTALGMSGELRLLSIGGHDVEARALAQLKRCLTCGAYQPAIRRRCELDGGSLGEVVDDAKPGGTIGVYRVLSLLGEGGMGRVFAGEHALLERRVAIKVLRARLATDAASESRFLFEARAASRLRHPNIVEVTDYGVLASGLPFFVMEWLDGVSLESHLAAGPLQPEVALRIARSIALGLGAAHEGGVVHNDLKPSNVILLGDPSAESPRLKIIDFGAASLAGVSDDRDVVGTASYMAPERIDGDQSDARSDAYSLGIMLYQMLVGAHAFAATDCTAMFRAHLAQIPEAVTSPHGVLPRRVVRLVMRALEKRPSERYQTMQQMIADIDQGLEALAAPAWRKWLP